MNMEVPPANVTDEEMAKALSMRKRFRVAMEPLPVQLQDWIIRGLSIAKEEVKGGDAE